MPLRLTSVQVADQAKAHKLYTDVSGFVIRHYVPMREFRWLTVVAPEGPADIRAG